MEHRMQLGIVGLGRMDANIARFRSRRQHTFAAKTLSAMRFDFGGHVKPVKK